jgi:hypothetical protein
MGTFSPQGRRALQPQRDARHPFGQPDRNQSSVGSADFGNGYPVIGHQSHHDHPEAARPGMGYSRMPVFCWTALASNLLIVAAFPILTATFPMLLLDRYCGFHFFTNDLGGNPMMYVNLIWIVYLGAR